MYPAFKKPRLEQPQEPRSNLESVVTNRKLSLSKPKHTEPIKEPSISATTIQAVTLECLASGEPEKETESNPETEAVSPPSSENEGDIDSSFWFPAQKGSPTRFTQDGSSKSESDSESDSEVDSEVEFDFAEYIKEQEAEDSRFEELLEKSYQESQIEHSESVSEKEDSEEGSGYDSDLEKLASMLSQQQDQIFSQVPDVRITILLFSIQFRRNIHNTLE